MRCTSGRVHRKRRMLRSKGNPRCFFWPIVDLREALSDLLEKLGDLGMGCEIRYVPIAQASIDGTGFAGASSEARCSGTTARSNLVPN
jgi:hypothetical protein